jgi:hypothetical protein
VDRRGGRKGNILLFVGRRFSLWRKPGMQLCGRILPGSSCRLNSSVATPSSHSHPLQYPQYGAKFGSAV